MPCSAPQPSKATWFAASPRVWRKGLGAQCWPPAPMAGGGLASRSPITHSTREAPQHQTRSPSSHNRHKGVTIPARLPRSGNPSPAATASSITCGGTGSVCPEHGQQLLAGQRSRPCWMLATMASPAGSGTGKAAARGTLLLAPCGRVSGRRIPGAGGGTLPGHPHVPVGAALCPPSPRAAQGHGSRGTWGLAGISPVSRHGGPAGRSAVTHAAPGDFCHGRAYAFRICL